MINKCYDSVYLIIVLTIICNLYTKYIPRYLTAVIMIHFYHNQNTANTFMKVYITHFIRYNSCNEHEKNFLTNSTKCK